MTARTDDSVRVALKELAGLERERAQAEEQREEARAAAEAARIEAAREAEAERARAYWAAEAEARERLALEARARDEEAERRIAMLRAELEAVRADRERIHATVAQLADEPGPATRRDARGYLAFAGALLVAAGILFVLVLRPPVDEQPIAQVQVQPPTSVAAPPEGSPSEPEPSEPEPAASVASADPEPAPEHRPDRPAPPHGSRPQSTMTDDDVDARLDFDHCGDDPTCGLDL